MADIPTAEQFSETMDPHEVLDFVIDLTNLLEPAETVADGEWTLVIPIEGAGLGLDIMSGGGRDPALTDGTGSVAEDMGIVFWLTIEDADQDDAIFDGAGTTIPLRVHAPTNSTPQRERERTVKVKVAQR